MVYVAPPADLRLGQPRFRYLQPVYTRSEGPEEGALQAPRYFCCIAHVSCTFIRHTSYIPNVVYFIAAQPPLCFQAVLQATEQATQGAGKKANQNGLLHPQYCESVYRSLRRPTRTVEVPYTI